MSEKNGKWMLAPKTDTEFWRATEVFDTKEEAIQAGMKAVRDFNSSESCEYIEDVLGGRYNREEMDAITSFAVGQIQVPGFSVSGWGVLEDIAAQVYDECGDVAEDYLDDVSGSEAEVLSNRLDKVLYEWMEEYKYLPHFYTIVNVEKVELGEDE